MPAVWMSEGEIHTKKLNKKWQLNTLWDFEVIKLVNQEESVSLTTSLTSLLKSEILWFKSAKSCSCKSCNGTNSCDDNFSYVLVILLLNYSWIIDTFFLLILPMMHLLWRIIRVYFTVFVFPSFLNRVLWRRRVLVHNGWEWIIVSSEAEERCMKTWQRMSKPGKFLPVVQPVNVCMWNWHIKYLY